jgi:putative methionine-R-sulfoxide reductase with GAF domain
MKAKEMFDKLGYEVEITDDINGVYYRYSTEYEWVCFYKYNKTYIVGAFYGEAKSINENLHKAIQQQLKELGWYND